MKIAIASDDGSQVAAHTGRCRGFAVYEIVDRVATALEYRDNRFTAHATGRCSGEHSHDEAGSHHSHASLLEAIVDCRVLVTRGLGPRLVADLASRGIDAYVCATDKVEEAASQFAEGRLRRVAGGGCCCHE